MPVPDSNSAAEAARYALLRRLAPSMRHHLVVNLQPIGMIYEVMDRRLRAPEPDLGQLRESANKINGFARAALNSSLDVVGWLAPDEGVAISVHECARECASLLATSMSFRGYALRNQVEPVPGEVRRSALRSLLTGTLVHVTDHQKPPAELVLAALPGPGEVVVRVSVQATSGDKGFSNEANYRKIDWADLEALAAAEGARLERDAEGVTFALPLAAA